MRAPEAPMGWPMAMAPPLTLTLDASRPSSRTTEIDCADGKSLNIGGSNNTLTVKGSCGSVSVGGADNRITLARIGGELSVVGLNNTITYADGSPTVDDAGSGNRISKGYSLG